MLVILFLNILGVFAHAYMKSPPVRRSKYSQYYLQNGLVDYNIMAPINAGYSFPCKGFPKGPSTTVITGNSINIEIEGSATHGGGHCQFGITINDNDFVVLKTVKSNCLLNGMSYTFSLPDNIPSTDITVFWSWINALGNREYYMDCADVTINNGNRNEGAVVTGLDLLVLNLPGYQTIPEFGNPGMYDGSDLLDARKQKSITVNKIPNVEVPKVEAPKVEAPKVEAPKVEAPKVETSNTEEKTRKVVIKTNKDMFSGGECEKEGQMKCGGDTIFLTCVHHKWVARECSTYTKCYDENNSILCK